MILIMNFLHDVRSWPNYPVCYYGRGKRFNRVRITLAGLVMLAAPLFSNAQTININGQIKDTETGAPIQGAKEVLINPINNARLDSTYTDVNGFYDLTYNWVGIQENQNITIDKLFPNPYTSETKINMLLTKDKEYKILAFDVQGRILFEKSQFLTKGAYEFSISGGQPGINFITITDGEKTKTYKGIQTTSTGKPIEIIINQMFANPQLKSTLDEILTEGDLAKIESSAEGYYEHDTTFTLQANQTINLNLQKIPITYGFNAIALNHKDTATENVAIKILWSDGIETTHYGQNGIINAQRTTTTDLSDTIYITNADTTIYSSLMWARKQSNPLDEANLFQTPAVPFQPVEPALAKRSELPDTCNLFMQYKQVPDPVNLGQYIRTDSETFLAFFLERSPGKTIRYTYAPAVIDSIDNFRMMRDEYTGQLVSQELFDQMCEQQDSALALFHLPYGINLIPPVRTENVDNPATNQRWIAAQARGWDQTMRITYNSSLSTLGIYGIIPTNIYTIIVNGQPTIRIKTGVSKTRQDAGPGVIREETVGNLMNGDDVNGGNSGPYLVGPNGENTEFAKVAAYTVYGLNPGSYAFQK